MLVHALGDGAATHFVNPSFTATFGYTLADLPTVAAGIERLYPDPEYRREVITRWWAEIAARKATGTVAPPGEYRIHDSDGRPRDVMIGFALQGELAIVTFQDLTEVRAAEAALEAERRANEQTAFALTENMPAGAYTMVLRPGAELAEFAFVSKQFLQMLELTREEAVGNPMTGFSRVHPEDRPRWLEINAEAFAERRRFSGEARIVANGETRWIRAESVPRELDDGSVIWEGILDDITRLKEAEDRLTTVLKASRGFTWKLDLRSSHAEYDANWAIVSGYAPGEWGLTVEQWAERVHPDDVAALMAELEGFRSGELEAGKITFRRRVVDDRWIWLQSHSGVSDRDAEGRPIILSGVSFDITAEMAERARVQEEQAQLREALQRAQQHDTLAQVSVGVAHDLNNLIAVVSGTAELLRARADGQGWLQEGLERIRRSVGMAQDLVGGLGGLVNRDQPRELQDLSKLLQDSVGLLGERRLQRHAVRLHLPEGKPEVWANATEFAQVVVNLAINACDSGPEDDIATVRVAALPPGTAAPTQRPDVGEAPPPGAPVGLFTVADTGAGITDSVRARMFRPHFTTKGKDGTGLGLLIVSTILQRNHAALWVDSTPGAGTTITVAWPASGRQPGRPALGLPGAAGASAEFAEMPPGGLDGENFLVVDDLADVGEVLATMLEAAGANAFTETDAADARAALAEAPGLWSALVTDLHMPGIDGHALARFAAGLDPPVPVVLVTARPEALSNGHAADFAVVLAKPVSAQQLVGAARFAADLRKAGTTPRDD